MDRIYSVLNEVKNGTTSPKQLFEKVKDTLNINLVNFQIFLDDLAKDAYIRFLGGNDSQILGDIILTDMGNGYLEDNKARLFKTSYTGPCDKWGKLKCQEQFMTNIDELCSTCPLRTTISTNRANQKMKIDTLKSVNSREYMIEYIKKEIDKDNEAITDLINYESTGGEPYRKNRVGLLLHRKDCVQFLNEQLQLLINNNTEVVLVPKSGKDYLGEIRAKQVVKMKEQGEQAEVERQKDFAVNISPTYDYSPSIADFKEEMTVQRANNADKYLLFLRESKKVYSNSKAYYQKWGDRGTGYSRYDIDTGILNIINPELEKEIALELVRNKDPFADGTLDLNGHIEGLKLRIENLESDEQKLFFLKAENERTKKYINGRLLDSVNIPTLKIEGVRAERIKVATQYLNEVTKGITEIEALNNKIPVSNANVIDNTKVNTDDKQPAFSFDYSNKNEYFYSGRIEEFKAIEERMILIKYITESGKWNKEKKYLVALIHILYNLKYLRPKVGKKNEKNTRLEYRRFFESRYKTNIAQEMKPTKFPIGKLNLYKPDFHFISDIDKL